MVRKPSGMDKMGMCNIAHALGRFVKETNVKKEG